VGALKLYKRENNTSVKGALGLYVGFKKGCADAYRYGFNTKKKVNEIAGIGNHNTALFWEYDTRLGRRWNVDPVVKSWQSDYSCLGDNPILRIDPKGDNDYKIDKKGHITLTKTTKEKKHTIFNSDGTKKITVNLDFFNTKFESSDSKDGKNSEVTVVVGKNIKDLKKAYKFFAGNTEVEWELNIFENKSKAGALATSHTKGSVESYAAVAWRALDKNIDLKLIYNSHSHPGEYIPESGWPAYPSGFHPSFKINRKESGDRAYFSSYKDIYGKRVPSMFNIYIPSRPMLIVNYDSSIVTRATSIPEITVSSKKKN
jgi:JAB-like toxin  1